MMVSLAVSTTDHANWRVHVERYADGSSAWFARLGRVIVKAAWR
jgi:hypothetical protein